MEQPRIDSSSYQTYRQCAKKRVLPQIEDSDFQQPSPIKKLAKNFENSVGFSETNYTYSKNISVQKAQSQVQGPPELNPSPLLNFTEQLKKAKLIPSGESGIARFKALLPRHLSERLSPKYETLLRIASETDKILQKRKICNYMQSFENVKGEIQYVFDMDITLQLYERINFLLKGYYCLFLDPLKNLVVGLPDQNVALPIRKYALRKELYFYAMAHTFNEQQLQNIEMDIPCQSFNVSKTALFFPLRPKTKLKKTTILQSKFVADLKQIIKEKETSVAEDKKCQVNIPHNSQLEGFFYELDQLFARFKVKNIYKVNIIQYFAKKGLSTKDIDCLLQHLSKLGGYLNIHQVSGRSVCVIDSSAKEAILQQIQAQP